MNDEKPPTTIEEAFANLDRILATMPAAKQRASQGLTVPPPPLAVPSAAKVSPVTVSRKRDEALAREHAKRPATFLSVPIAESMAKPATYLDWSSLEMSPIAPDFRPLVKKHLVTELYQEVFPYVPGELFFPSVWRRDYKDESNDLMIRMVMFELSRGFYPHEPNVVREERHLHFNPDKKEPWYRVVLLRHSRELSAYLRFALPDAYLPTPDQAERCANNLVREWLIMNKYKPLIAR